MSATPNADISPETRLESVGVLDALTRAARITFEPSRGMEAWWQSTRQWPGLDVNVWSDRLAFVGHEIGLRVNIARKPLLVALNAIRPGAPIATYAIAGPASGQWFVLAEVDGSKIRVLAQSPEQQDEWITIAELAERLGLGDTRSTLEWAMVEPALPCQAIDREHIGITDQAQMASRALRRTFALLFPERRDLIVVAMFAGCIGLLALVTPIAIETLVNTVAFNNVLQPILVLSLIVAIALSFAALLRALQTYVLEILERRLFARIVADFSYRLPRARVDAYEHHYGPELVNRFFDAFTLQKSLTTLALDGVQVGMQTIIGMAVLAFYHPFLLGFDIILLMSMIFVLVVLGRGAIRTNLEESARKYEIASWLEQLAANARSFKQPASLDFAVAESDARVRRYLRDRKAHFAIGFRQLQALLVLEVLASTTLLGLGGWLVITGSLTLGQLVAAELIVGVIVGSFAKLAKYVMQYYDLVRAVEKLGHIVDVPVEANLGEAIPPLQVPISLKIEALTVESHGHVLVGGVTFSSSPGERIALVADHSSTTTGVLETLYGLRGDYGGSVRIDGLELNAVRLDSLRQSVAFAGPIEVIADTMLENMRMGRFDSSLHDIQTVVDLVGLTDEVRRLPQGLNTPLLPSGYPLPMDSLVRLMLARAILGKPRLLLVDRLLDMVEKEVVAQIVDRRQPWTLVVATSARMVTDACDRTLEWPHSFSH